MGLLLGLGAFLNVCFVQGSDHSPPGSSLAYARNCVLPPHPVTNSTMYTWEAS